MKKIKNYRFVYVKNSLSIFITIEKQYFKLKNTKYGSSNNYLPSLYLISVMVV